MAARIERDLEYGRVGERTLRLDLFHPDKPNGAAVLMLHGGGWRQGSREMVAPQAEVLAASGFLCAACEYRLTPEAPWPAQIHDVKAAFRWLRRAAPRFGVDPEKIAVHGNSAGGHLALLIAGTAGEPDYDGASGTPGVGAEVAAVIAVFPPTSFYVGARTSGANAAQALLGKAPDAEEAARMSPITHVHAHFPPTLFLHGNADKVVPVSASINMYQALAKAGAPAELHVYSDVPHGWARWPAWVEPTMSQAAVFLRRYVLADQQFANPTPSE